MGIRHLLLSNAAGSLNRNYRKGSLVLLDDHINFLPDNPLRGLNHTELGPRFPDMSQPYSIALNALFKQVAQEQNISLPKGIYVAVPGPNLETRAEYRMFSNYADMVGMSTVPEVIVANHMGLPRITSYNVCYTKLLRGIGRPFHRRAARLNCAPGIIGSSQFAGIVNGLV